MLLELKVQNFAIIDNLELSFGPGFNVLSGETGAGKSIVLKSLALLMGEKALADTVRSGADTAVVEGYFDVSDRTDIQQALKDLGIPLEEDSLIVRRMISVQGKSKVYLNGSLCPLTTLRDVVAPLITVTGQAAPLIEMTGQHDNRHLQSKAYHLDLLDQYTGAWKTREEFAVKFARLEAIADEIQRITEDARTREQRLDFLTYQKEEIEAVRPQVGEDQDLESSLTRARGSSRLIEFAEFAQGALYSDDDSVLVRIHKVQSRLSELKNLDEDLERKLQSLSQAKTLLEDAVYEVREYAKNLQIDPAEMNQLEERLSAIRKLQKKYGTSIEDILLSLDQITQEIETLTGSDERLKELEKEQLALRRQMKALAEDLHARRLNGAKLLEKGVNDELNDLNMKGVGFRVKVEALAEWNRHGSSDVEFMIQAGAKDEPRPMAKVASGGELSRILLSLKRIVGASNQPRTYLFDEVDTGVSGQTAEKVGRKLKAIAVGQQVVCVTHLPQVASFADSHYLIEKSPTKAGVKMSVRILAKNDRVREIARLISGEKITQTSLDHAKQLLSEVH